jgi:hypothetical protein
MIRILLLIVSLSAFLEPALNAQYTDTLRRSDISWGPRFTITDGSIGGTPRFHPQYEQNDYWKKHKTFKTLGWTSLGVGITLTFAGLVAAIARIERPRTGSNAYLWLMGSGAAITLSGIPFFILSHKYKMKARKPNT